MKEWTKGRCEITYKNVTESCLWRYEVNEIIWGILMRLGSMVGFLVVSLCLEGNFKDWDLNGALSTAQTAKLILVRVPTSRKLRKYKVILSLSECWGYQNWVVSRLLSISPDVCGARFCLIHPTQWVAELSLIILFVPWNILYCVDM